MYYLGNYVYALSHKVSLSFKYSFLSSATLFLITVVYLYLTWPFSKVRFPYFIIVWWSLHLLDGAAVQQWLLRVGCAPCFNPEQPSCTDKFFSGHSPAFSVFNTSLRGSRWLLPWAGYVLVCFFIPNGKLLSQQAVNGRCIGRCRVSVHP